MRPTRPLLIVLITWLGAALGAHAQPEVKKYSATEGVTFALRDELHSPVYSWPATLLTYHVDFRAAKIRAAQLELRDASTTQPFQLSEITEAPDGTLATANVSLMSDLPPGGTRTYNLFATPTPEQPASTKTLTITQNGATIELSNGLLKVRIPASQVCGKTATAPAPICGIAAPDTWIGSTGRILSPAKKPLRLETECLDNGPLYITYRMTYTFEQGARYIATVRLVAGYRHVEFSERMENFEPGDHARVEMPWSDFSPTLRYAAHDWETPPGKPGLGISEPIQTDGLIEEPHWFPANRNEDPATDMLYRLAAFQGNEPRDAIPVMSFWDDRPGGRELSVFVPNTSDWDDGQYAIWQPTTRLQVHFRYTDGTLVWTWPLATGRRVTGITLHDTAWGEKQVEQLRTTYLTEAKNQADAYRGSWSPSIKTFRARYAQLLRSWHGLLDLDKVKDWTLTYPDTARKPPAPLPGTGEKNITPQKLEDALYHSPLMLYPLGANLAVINISHRILRPYIDDYQCVRNDMTPAQRRRIDALLLLTAYATASDDFSPMRVCATGTPNMSADGFCAPAEINSLYPDHPAGREWREQFQKIVELQGVYYTRPAVHAWDARGGRWTESLAVYNWAYLLPVETAQLLTRTIDGQNRIATPEMAARGRWMVDELTAPINNPDPDKRLQRLLSGKSNAPTTSNLERQYPAHGAHSTGSGTVPPDLVGVLGRILMRYDPLTAEHLLWVQAQTRSHDKGEWKLSPLYKRELDALDGNTGTPPRLTSSKYTGHGIILRAGVGTPEELSLHLDQIDQGPNYRWGNNGEGSSGVLYFYAGGQVWSGHERENTGDHTNDDTTGNTNFGVLKDRAYRTIGANSLDQPLYDLDVAQFASIAARADHDPYSWPQYKSRALQLIGTDYFLIIDDASGCSRFSWFTMRDLPFPKLVFLAPLQTRPDHWAEIITPMSHGVLRDSVREATGSIVLVTHKKDSVEMQGLTPRPLPYLERSGINEYRPDKNAPQERGVYRVSAPGSQDMIFCATTPIAHTAEDAVGRPEDFEGTNGVIRRRDDGTVQLALLRGTRISAAGVTLQTRAEDALGVSASFAHPNEIAGVFYAPGENARLRVALPENAAGKFYIDGAPVGVERLPNANIELWFAVPQGRHTWQFTADNPTPCASHITRTVNQANGADVYFDTVAGATTYRIETSADGCRTWTRAGETKTSPYKLAGFTNGKKIHVRIFAANATRTSEPGDAYPLYVSENPPQSPDGLILTLAKDRVTLTWGEVLGAGEYRVYRRKADAAQWEKIYSGLEHTCIDTTATGVTPPAQYPGAAANLGFEPSSKTLYEYTVTCVNGNGESDKCASANTDPTRWRNWWPQGQERRFKRVTSYWEPPYVAPEAVPPTRYP